MSFFTCFWLFPQNKHLSRSPPSPMRATRCFPFALDPLCSAEPGACAALSASFPWAGALSPLRRYLAGPPVRAPLGPTRSKGGVSTEDSAETDRGLTGGDDLVDKTVRQGLLGREDLVPLDVVADLLDGRRGVLGQHLL